MLTYRNVEYRSASTYVQNEGVSLTFEVYTESDGKVLRRGGLIIIEGLVQELGQRYVERREVAITAEQVEDLRRDLVMIDNYVSSGNPVGRIEKEVYTDVIAGLRVGYVNGAGGFHCYLRSTKNGVVIEAQFERLSGLFDITESLSRISG